MRTMGFFFLTHHLGSAILPGKLGAKHALLVANFPDHPVTVSWEAVTGSPGSVRHKAFLHLVPGHPTSGIPPSSNGVGGICRAPNCVCVRRYRHSCSQLSISRVATKWRSSLRL